MLVLVICVGYFIFDIGWCIWFYDPNEKFMLLHHILTIFGMFLVLHSGRAGTELSATIFGTELSNPFLQIRWFMRESGYDNTWLYEINDFVFMMVFFICRSCIGTYFLYTEWSHPRPWLRFKLGGTAIYLISVVFTINIASFAFKKYTRMFRRWKSRRKIANGDIRNGHVCMKHKSE
uniref:Transmembrane protein 136-like n=1 Tax=Saccoglossus kowalevskii TaxID=10224 RepID=A0ABM0MI90_SACKO|nr:PREDICTED: transmembrane protein 136-like [Saccoglossus kowalevskii]